MSSAYSALRRTLMQKKVGRQQVPGIDGLVELQSGDALIGRIYRAIQLQQPVLLYGPRGCGKTYCADKAIELAMTKGIIAQKGLVKAQGNRELPRDTLIEDDIAFTLRDGTVVPTRVSAPLLRFVRREADGSPITRYENGKNIAVMEYLDDPQAGSKPFVLFLDEINRYADGVLDSLLSVLEEREVYWRGMPIVIPVAAVLTMNPPGYDATAKPLSPPLAARIGQGFRLYTPDLNGLSDTVVAEALRSAEAAYSRSKTGGALFPIVNSELRRLACLATLALWGHATPNADRVAIEGSEYLTSGTRKLLEGIAEDEGIRPSMKALAELCRFGPDARAAGAWLVAACMHAVEEREGGTLGRRHLLNTARECLSHRLFDRFVPGLEPRKVAEKERAMMSIVDYVLRSGRVRKIPGVLRDVDRIAVGRGAELTPWAALFITNAGGSVADCRHAVQQALIGSSVVDNAEVQKVLEVVGASLNHDAEPLIVVAKMSAQGLIEDISPEADGGPAKGFIDPRIGKCLRRIAAAIADLLAIADLNDADLSGPPVLAAAMKLVSANGVGLKRMVHEHEVTRGVIGEAAAEKMLQQQRQKIPLAAVKNALTLADALWYCRPIEEGEKSQTSADLDEAFTRHQKQREVHAEAEHKALVEVWGMVRERCRLNWEGVQPGLLIRTLDDVFRHRADGDELEADLAHEFAKDVGSRLEEMGKPAGGSVMHPTIE